MSKENRERLEWFVRTLVNAGVGLAAAWIARYLP